jgi:hypothetical protein
MHSLHGGIIVSWLACNVPKPFCGKVGMKDKEFPMIVLAKAWILEDGFVHIVPGAIGLNVHLAPGGSVFSSLINLQRGAILTLKFGIKHE